MHRSSFLSYQIQTSLQVIHQLFNKREGSNIKLNEDITLPLLAAIEKIGTFTDAWNSEHELEIGLYRMSVPDFNKCAVREAIVNAFSHRDYTKMGRVRISITDEGMTVEPHGRNPLLADVIKKGIDEIRHLELVLSLASSQPFISRNDVVNLLHVSPARAYMILKKLSEEGKLEPVNKGKYAKYKLLNEHKKGEV